MNHISSPVNSNFSFPRFSLLAKSDFIVNKTKYMRAALATVGCFLACAILTSILIFNNVEPLDQLGIKFTESQQYEYLGYYLLASFILICLAPSIFGSLMFSDMKSKGERLNTLMVPASMVEKFLLRLLIYFLGASIILGVGFLIGLLEISFTYLDFANVLQIFNFEIGKCVRVTIMILLPLIWEFAFYAVGSALWPRNSWVKTWVVQEIISVFFIIVASFGMLSSIPHFLNQIVSFNEFFWLYFVIFIVLIVGFLALAWWRFRTTQIVQRFMKK